MLLTIFCSLLCYLLLGLSPGWASETVSWLPPPPGKLVDIGAQRLHLICQGHGRPVVILEAGLGGSAMEWHAEQKTLAEYVETCSYDRAGYGWSDAGREPRTSGRIVAELASLLKTARLPGPYILVGHSFGGFTMQLFARRYPHLTAALVLVDSSHAQQYERYARANIGIRLTPQSHSHNVQFSYPAPLPQLPPALQELTQRILFLPRTRHTIADEFLHLRQSAEELRSAGSLPQIPLVVLSRGQRAAPNTAQGETIERIWRELQADLVNSTPYGIHIIAEHSGHHIHLDEPQAVSEGILMAIRASQSLCLQQARYCRMIANTRFAAATGG